MSSYVFSSGYNGRPKEMEFRIIRFGRAEMKKKENKPPELSKRFVGQFVGLYWLHSRQEKKYSNNAGNLANGLLS